MKKTFTLVELIIVITILAILSVSAFLVVSQWIGKSRDSRRLSDLGTIQRALEVSLTENSKYPTPDTSINITAGLNIVGQQGKFGDSSTAATDIKTTPKDPLDNAFYTYYVATGGKDYQLMGFLENSSSLTFRGIESQRPRSTVSDQENLQFSNSACTCNSNGTNSICSVASLAFCLNYAHASEVSAADYSVRIPTVKGETLGILILSGTNQPVEELGSAIDIASTTTAYTAYFSDKQKLSGTGNVLAALETIVKNNANAAYIVDGLNDPSLIGYWDMETTINSGGTTFLKDITGKGNNGRCYNLSTPISCFSSSLGPQVGSGTNKSGKSIYLNGQSAAYISGSSSFMTTGNWTRILLVKPSIPSNPSLSFAEIVTERSTSNKSLFRVSAYGNYETYYKSGGGFSVFQTGKNLNTFDTMAMVKNGAVVKYYINGELKMTQGDGADFPSDDNSVYIGTSTSFTAFLIGYVDEFRIYNRALSDSEISTLSSQLR